MKINKNILISTALSLILALMPLMMQAQGKPIVKNKIHSAKTLTLKKAAKITKKSSNKVKPAVKKNGASKKPKAPVKK